MTSTITEYANNIDINFPVPGKALSTIKEFHSNFNKIQKSFTRASSEINQLEITSVKFTENADFGGQIIKKANFENQSWAVNDIGLLTDVITNIDCRLGYYHKIKIENGTYSFNIVNWPDNNRHSKIRIELINNLSTTTTSYINFSGNIQYIGSIAGTLTLPGDKSAFYDVWTVDNGESIFVKPLSTTYISTSTPSGGGGGGGGGTLPSITYINPQQAGSSGGYSMGVVGTNFGATPQIIVNGNQTPTITSSSTTEVYFYSIAGMAGLSHSVVVRTAAGDSNVVYYWLYEDAPGD